MGKKQRERKQQKLANKPRGNAPPSWMTDNVSPEAERVMQKLARMNPLTDEAIFMNALMNSADLRDEPELRDFELDAEAVGRAVNRLLPKYEPMLERAKARSQEEFETTYDDMRIEAFDMVLTREQRRDFLNRYDAMLQRLLQGRDTKKIERALIARTFLEGKGFPWGAHPILVAVFEDAKTAAFERYEQATGMLLELLKQEDPEAGQQQLLDMLQDPQKIEQLTHTLNVPPALLEEMSETTDEVLDEFNNAVFAGEIELDLFTDQELLAVGTEINAFMQNKRLDAQKELSTEAGREFVQRVANQLDEIMTDARFAQMEREMETIEKEWFAKGLAEAALLQIEHNHLRDVKASENHFLYTVLLGQLRRATEQENAQEKQTDREASPAVLTATGFRERIGSILKRK